MQEPREHPVPRPSDDALINTYLRPKIAGDPFPGDFVIHEADVYSEYPYELVRRYAPAHGAGDGDGASVWYFFSPVRYATENRRWRKVGPDGKGVWHPEGRAKDAKGSSGGTLQKLTYKEKSAAAIVKPGWLMTEYAASQEHGHGGLVLCKIYRSPRGQGSDAPLRGATACSGGHKRKASTSLSPPPQRRAREDDGVVSTHHQNLWTEQVHDDGAPEIQAGLGDVDAFAALRAFMDTDEDEMGGIQLPANFDPEEYLLGEQQHQPGTSVPLEECVQSPSEEDDDVIEFSLEELMRSCSSAPGECSRVPISPPYDPWMTPALCAF